MKGCFICEANVTKRGIKEEVIPEKPDYLTGRNLPFDMLIHELIPDPTRDPREVNLKGCQIFMPETLFFEKGRPVWLAQTKKHSYYLTKVNSRGLTEQSMKSNIPWQKYIQSNKKERQDMTSQFWMQEARIHLTNCLKNMPEENLSRKEEQGYELQEKQVDKSLSFVASRSP